MIMPLFHPNDTFRMLTILLRFCFFFKLIGFNRLILFMLTSLFFSNAKLTFIYAILNFYAEFTFVKLFHILLACLIHSNHHVL